MKDIITYAVGDVHGRADLLKAVIHHAISDAMSRNAIPKFIFLGDICDRGPRSRQALDLVADVLGDFEGSVLLKSNHDDMFAGALRSMDRRQIGAWLSRGGMQTLASYCPSDLNGAFEVIRTLHQDHLRMIDDAASMYVENGIVFAHAGINPDMGIQQQDDHDLMWIRDGFLEHVGYLDAVVVHGHTVVGDLPVATENRVSIDTGAHTSGRLTVAAIQNGEFRFFQTDGCASRVVEVEAVRLDRGLGTCLGVCEAMALAA